MRAAYIFAIICVSMIVLPLSAQSDTPEPQPDYFIEADVSTTEPYAGQQILYTVRYYATSLEPIPEDSPVTWPDFEGFWQSNVFPQNIRRETINEVQYYVGILNVELSPLEPGALVIAPSEFNVERQGVFSNGSQREYRSNAVRLRAKPLPPDAPQGFNGAVGEYSMDAEINTLELTLGNPLELTMDVQGLGNLELLPRPPLNFGAGWRTLTQPANPPRYADNTVGGIRLGQKVFEWLVIPETTGTLNIPPVTFTFFNPELEAYRTVEAPSFTINVFPGETGQRQLESPEGRAVPETRLALKPVPDGVNSTTAGTTERVSPLLWILPPALTAAVLTWRWGRARYALQRAERRRKRALHKAREAIKRLQGVSPEKAGTYLRAIIAGYAADVTDGDAEAYNNQWDEAIIQDLKPSQAARNQLKACLQEADSLRYMPPDVSTSVKPLLHKTLDALRQIDAEA